MTPAPHRLMLSAGEFAYLVEKVGVELPPDWMPADVRSARPRQVSPRRRS